MFFRGAASETILLGVAGHGDTGVDFFQESPGPSIAERADVGILTDKPREGDAGVVDDLDQMKAGGKAPPAFPMVPSGRGDAQFGGGGINLDPVLLAPVLQPHRQTTEPGVERQRVSPRGGFCDHNVWIIKEGNNQSMGIGRARSRGTAPATLRAV